MSLAFGQYSCVCSLAIEELTRKQSPAQGSDRIRGTPQSGPCRRLGTNEARCGRRRPLTAWRRVGGQLGRLFAAQAEGAPVAGPAQPLLLGHGSFQLPQRGRDFTAGAQATLREHLAQVVLDGSRTDK